MTTSVTAILERQFGQMPGLKEMSSVSSAGSSVVTLQFDLNLSLDIAEQEVQAAINAGGSLLPQPPAPPVYAKVNPADAPVITLAISSSTLPHHHGRRSGRYPHRPENLPAGRCRPGQHLRRPSPGGARAGQSAAAGVLWPEHRRPAHHRSPTPIPMRPRAISTAPPSPIRSTPTISCRARRTTQTSWSPTRTARRCICRMSPRWWKAPRTPNYRAGRTRRRPILLNVQRQPGANVIAVVDSIKALLPQIKAGLPASVDVTVLTDRTNTIRASVADVEFELLLAVALVVLVIYRLPAQPAGDLHSQPVGAAFHRRHLRGDVSAGLFAQQSVADGADHFAPALWSTTPS